MAPSISIREHIRWLPDPPSEPTSTLVLTSAEKHFVDIRILNPPAPPSAASTPKDILPLSRLDWAFAGTSKSSLRHDGNGAAFTHSTWYHWIDSHSRNVDGVSDEGDMFPQADGRTLELGTMVNPATGRLTEYEETWWDPKARAIDRGGSPDERKCCVVLQLHDDEHEARGMVVRVGQYAQGLLRVGGHLSLERWGWKGEEGGWQRSARMGDLWLPCGAAMEEKQVREGGEVRYGEYVWKVVELSYF